MPPKLPDKVPERLVVGLGRHVRREGVHDAVLEHAADRTLGQLLRVELVDVLLLELGVGLAEGGEVVVRRGASTTGPAGGKVSADEQEGADDRGDGEGHHPREDAATSGRHGRRSHRLGGRLRQGRWVRVCHADHGVYSWDIRFTFRMH